MQNQRQNGRPDAAVRMAGLFLVLFCVAAILIPAKTLFTGNGFFADYIHFTESKRMYVEIAILAVLIFGGLALLKRGRSRMCWLTAVVLVFSWIHVVFLPMVVSAVYLISLLAIGRFLRKRVFFRGTVWERPYFSFYMDFLFGASFAIVVYCLLSALGVGKIAWMRLSVYALGVAALGFDLNLAFDDLRFLPLSPAMETGTVLVWKKDQALTPVVEAFHQHIRNVQPAYGGQENMH